MYGRWVVVVALGLTAASLARLFGADWPTLGIAWLAGSTGMWLRQELGRRGFNVFFIPFAAALVSGVVGGAAVLLGVSGTPALCLVAPGMIIVPGVPLVNGVQDMFKNHMTQGLARLGLGVLITMAIAFGLFVATLLTGAKIPVDAPLQLLSVPESSRFPRTRFSRRWRLLAIYSSLTFQVASPGPVSCAGWPAIPREPCACT